MIHAKTSNNFPNFHHRERMNNLRSLQQSRKLKKEAKFPEESQPLNHQILQDRANPIRSAPKHQITSDRADPIRSAPKLQITSDRADPKPNISIVPDRPDPIRTAKNKKRKEELDLASKHQNGK